ncbi:MAG: AsmA family protein [Mesonia hippocampi]|uniref:AsmA family protein n=1 Tax=Mesonia hippocampi TaxID=1628250 RepID=UPI003F9C3AEC
MKKIFKLIGILLLLLIIALLVIPFFFKDKLEAGVKNAINENINAEVNWKKLNLSLLSSFPKASLGLHDVSVINKAPFQGDTLAQIKDIELQIELLQLLKGTDNINIKEFLINKANITVKVDSLGNANYNIAKESKTPTEPSETPTEKSAFNLGLQHYKIANSNIRYNDKASNMTFLLEDFNHEGTGDFSASTSKLKTKTNTAVSFITEDVAYLNKHRIKLDADFNMDLEKMKFEFLDNKALINQLPLAFNGYVQVNEKTTETKLNFSTPNSDFRNFLGLIPETYAKDISDVKTSGDFSINGQVEGVIDETHIPTFAINIKSNKAYFKYPSLPKAVNDIDLDIAINNETGILENTYVNLNNLRFRIDQDQFKASGKFKDITSNAKINLTANGILNLANIEQVYPIELDTKLNGVLSANITTQFDMNSLEKEQYHNIKSNGEIGLNNFSYTSDDFANPIAINQAKVLFNLNKVNLEQLTLTTGKTDASFNGNIENIMGYLFADQDLKGVFNVSSNTFSINDFMVSTTQETPKTSEASKEKPQDENTPEEQIKIPSFLDATLNFTANTVIYDNLNLKNVKGSLRIKDETASLTNITSDLFGGNIRLNGNVSTKNNAPTFATQLELNHMNIAQSFTGIGLLQSIAPIANTLDGDFSTRLSLKGNLTKTLTPVLGSLAGNAFAEVIEAQVNSEKSPLLKQLDSRIDKLSFDNLNLKEVTASLNFDNGQVKVKPFNIAINKDVNIQVAGSHGFDNSINYQLAVALPASYLGKDIGSNLAKLSNQDLENTLINLPVGVSGNFTNPQLQLDIQQATKDLGNKIIEEQKDNLKDKAKDEISKFLDNNNETENTKEDKIDKEEVKDAAKDLIKGVFGKKK